jgi:hypothetical protein
MNTEIVLGRWMQLMGRVRECWGWLTRNKLRRITGQQLVMLGQLRSVGGEAVELLRRSCLPEMTPAAIVSPSRAATTPKQK